MSLLLQGKPYLSMREDAEAKNLTGNDQFEGYVADLAKEVADRIGIDYLIRPVRDGNYGSKVEETGKWNGMIGELIDGVSSKPTL